ncbi:MAG: shikimate dehydrogenase [Gammaproteobacteria bacterium]|nr:MAG: shikimate dehydrogenase [Gammaproteobacteria bacterium]
MNTLDSIVDRYAVMGHPIQHSKSPRIHNAFAQQFGLRIEYTALDVTPESFASEVERFNMSGGKGLNITVPLKELAWGLVQTRSPQAELAGAVNTLKFNGDSIAGFNTDGIGLIRDITVNKKTVLTEKDILLLGAGGAVRGVLLPLLEQAPTRVVIANRTFARARELVDRFHGYGNISASGFEGIKDQHFDVVINGTAASLQGEVPPLPEALFNPDALAYDMMYSDQDTAFMAWASVHGAIHVSDGLGMLVEQAAESFSLWRGVQPNTAPVMKMLRAA